MNLPFREEIFETFIIRTFNPVDKEEFHWHQDAEHRICEVLEGDEWSFQFDDELPFELKFGQTFEIEKLKFHRILPGKTKLILKIQKVYD